MKKAIYAIVEKTVFSIKNTEMLQYLVKTLDISTLEKSFTKIGVKVGDKVRIVSGRKNPIGTEGIVSWCGENKFADTFTSELTGQIYHENPSIRLKLENGTEVWTTGNNCINISSKGEVGIQTFEDREAFETWRESIKENFKSSKPMYSFEDNEIIERRLQFGDLYSKSYSIYEDYIHVYKDRIAAIVYDFVFDIYIFIAFDSNLKPGNIIEYVSKGVARNLDDPWRGETGFGAAKKAFDNFIEAN